MAEEKKTERSAKAKKPSIFERAKKWCRELQGETKKIVWPTRERTLNNTLVVLAVCLVVGVFIWVLDAIFNFGIQALIGIFA
jgi:preprotein translocase subunit SecE